MIGPSPSELQQVDVLIIGGGPAGLTAGLYTARAGVETLILAGSGGSRLTMDYRVENYPGFIEIESGRLLQLFREHATFYGARLVEEDAVEINLGSDPKMISSRSGLFQASTVIIATGRPAGKVKMVPGEERLIGSGVSYCAVCDGPFFRGKKALLVGSGEEAAEDCLALRQMGVDVEWLPGGKGEFEPDPASLSAIRKAGVVWREGAVLKEIRGERVVEAAVCDISGVTEEVAVDGVFIIRPMPFSALFADSGLKIDSGSCVSTDRSQKTNLPGVFVAGDISCGGMQVVTAVGEGASAAMQALKHLRARA